MTREQLMEIIAQRISRCTACALHTTRTNVVVGEGSLYSPIMFVGEGPGEEEDKTGRPFVGKAGQLLTKILESVNIRREDVYICNIVKCRPPNNRVPKPEEQKACGHFLIAQIMIVDPQIIIPLGSTALSFFLNQNLSISEYRGKEMDWKGGKKLFPMFHPSFLLRNPSKEKGSPKDLTWQDIKKVRTFFDQYKRR
ncbi:MAG TPA: uracil-DNA glycosylase [Pseudothermotoga sp.]|nr:uracil-DNA glycosylase [Pseudothermotoga sp.]HOK83538.1 uracil-DNA glycosylase [Pseudothermotoga sp.]HPP69611.1 uracil-DNA glycosylase [Pseudothermotoga sp.]